MSHFEEAIKRYIPDLRRYALALLRDRTEVEDIVQESLMRVLARRHLWDGIRNPRSYLFTILHNVHIDRIASRRRAGVQVQLDLAVTHLSHHALSYPAPQPGSLELQDLERGLQELRPEQREVILLVGLEGMSYQQAAQMLGVPLGTVMSRLSRGREALRKMMEGEERRGLRRAKNASHAGNAIRANHAHNRAPAFS